MTYVMSDIHGNFDKYESMLKLINLSDGDELYAIGDAIDRGKDGIRVFRDIMQRPNVHMLLGNHEWMAIETIWAGDERSKGEMLKLWIRNGGTITYFDLMKLDTGELDKIVSCQSVCFCRDSGKRTKVLSDTLQRIVCVSFAVHSLTGYTVV